MSMNKRMYCKREECPTHAAMTPFEHEAHYVFVCPTCNSVQIWDKRRPEIGGTIGAGLKTNGRRSATGRGF